MVHLLKHLLRKLLPLFVILVVFGVAEYYVIYEHISSRVLHSRQMQQVHWDNGPSLEVLRSTRLQRGVRELKPSTVSVPEEKLELLEKEEGRVLEPVQLQRPQFEENVEGRGRFEQESKPAVTAPLDSSVVREKEEKHVSEPVQWQQPQSVDGRGRSKQETKPTAVTTPVDSSVVREKGFELETQKLLKSGLKTDSELTGTQGTEEKKPPVREGFKPIVRKTGEKVWRPYSKNHPDSDPVSKMRPRGFVASPGRGRRITSAGVSKDSFLEAHGAPGRPIPFQHTWLHSSDRNLHHLELSSSDMKEKAKIYVEEYKRNQYLDSLRNDFCKHGIVVECSKKPMRVLTPFEKAGNNIMFTVRTTLSFHKKRLPVLLQTWMTTVNSSNIFIVSDGRDPNLQDLLERKGYHYSITSSPGSYDQGDMCCKAGHELSLLFYPGNEHYDWLCHVDDDAYVILPSLVKTLSKFDPKTEPVYFGRPEPRVLSGEVGGIPYKDHSFYFAPGCMYCLSRPMLQKASKVLIGCNAFKESCNKTAQPEDVTVALAVEIAMEGKLNGTYAIYSHAMDLTISVPQNNLKEQIAVTYGTGQIGNVKKGGPNVVTVKNAMFDFDDDPSQFKSLHCHLHPETDWCVKRRNEIMQSEEKWISPWQRYYMERLHDKTLVG